MFSSKTKDFLCWTHVGAAHDLSEDSQLFVNVGARYRDHATEIYHKFMQLGVSYRYNSCWTIIPSFFQRRLKRDDKWRSVSNLRLAVTRNWEIAEFKFSDRSILDYRSSTHHLRYRNRFEVVFPAIFSSKLIPIISNELFFEKLTDFSQDRFRIGVQMDFNRSFQFRLGYMLQLHNHEKGVWNRYNAIWSNLSIKF